jgi:TolB-like protein/Tfp pilus assembly protein PilF
MMHGLQAGTRLGPYEIVGLLGAGGMGEVFRARDSRLGRDVAIKVLPPGLANDRTRLQRFRHEALATAALNQPNILAIYDVGSHDGSPYLVSELLEGQTLRERLADGPLPSRQALDYSRQILQGLRAAHAKGIVHRDLKPENLFLTSDGRAKILDFGLAKLTRPGVLDAPAETTTVTDAQAPPGTVQYMSPEQLRGQPADSRSDLFSLGIVFYEMLAGRRPFARESAADTVSAILNDDPPALSTQAPEVPAAVEVIVARCLQKEPERRFQSAADLEFALSSVDINVLAAGRLARRPGLRARASRAGLRLAAAAALTAMAIGLGTGRGQMKPSGNSAALPAPVADARRVIAVLPFKNISRDKGQDYFAAGITEEIHGQLSRIATLRLLGRASVERYKSADVRTLAADLGAGSVIEGSVRSDGQRIRIAVELVDARTAQTTWSEQYDRDLQDIFSVQSDIALRVAARLNVSPSPEERRRLEKQPTQNLAAYDLYLRAEQEPDRLKAIAMQEKVVQLDPGFADAHASIAYHMVMLSSSRDRRYLASALEAARRAVSSDPSLPSAHMTLATVYLEMGLISDARLSYLRAIDLNPNDGPSMKNLSVLELGQGRYDEAFLWGLRAFRTSPIKGANDYYHAALPTFLLDEGAGGRWLREAERRFPGDARIQILLALLDARRGRMADALVRARRLAAEPDPDAEALALGAELTYVSGESDAERYTERLFGQMPGITGNFWFLMESPRVRYAHLLARAGRHGLAERLLAAADAEAVEALERGHQSPRMWVERAIIHALRREHDATLAFLERAYDAGLRDDVMLTLHPALAGMKESVRYQALVRRIGADLSAMRRRTDVEHTLPPLSAR